jgi:CMP-2-keto-3-deoxyoctulosonic acid synthetase
VQTSFLKKIDFAGRARLHASYTPQMHRVVILDIDHPQRLQLADSVRRTANTEVVLAASEDELVAKVKFGTYAAVFADESLLTSGSTRLLEAVRSAIVRPMVVVASNGRSDDLDPDLVTLVVHKPYDVSTLTGILLSAVLPQDGNHSATIDPPTAS